MKETLRYLVGIAGPSGYGSKASAEKVTESFQFSSPFTAIITGATSGIGEETARVLAKRGVRIVMAARDMKKAAKVKERIKRESPEAEILVSEIDLSSLASVRRFCVEFAALGLPLNILINNGGVFSPNLEYSEDKFELTFATNYLGHYLLTELLLDKLIETSKRTGIQGRIINVSSVVHYWVKREDLCFIHLLNPNKYNGTRAYAQSKLACILHAKEVARKLKEQDANVTINAVHPGIVKTAIIRAHRGFITDSLFFMASKLLKSIPQGAATTCYVALSPQTQRKTGKYFADCNKTKCSSLANDELTARTLWMQTRALILRELGEPA
ncbi:short-chain dehydrogenase TIC 32 A, chloroplastic-like isoform X2 [Benincasa hispida]|uniref:short-chain dehydrogenase TIC 32 A, chloroplastic-like isoform X2 n=1 Tax=Benincasa hispida TaxID=102211 RepID=UPI0019009B93|nr:short-chain dehydrogenase TIC 32 A, chloroplastic-like isoform X2 [Benincasa hispida]